MQDVPTENHERPRGQLVSEILRFANLLQTEGLDFSSLVVAIEGIRSCIAELSPLKTQPVDHVRWVSLDDIQANDYNPNSVAAKEMQLLQVSIKHDGYTQPVVTIYDKAIKKYVIVDGFHRYFTMKSDPSILESTNGLLPIVVIDKPANDRIASTVRHNRARGKHSVAGMSKLVFEMMENGWSDADICNELGMEPEELLRLKHITGFSKLFAKTKYRQAWTTRNQIKYASEHGTIVK